MIEGAVIFAVSVLLVVQAIRDARKSEARNWERDNG